MREEKALRRGPLLASYTALDLAGRIRASRGRPQRAWLSSAAIAMAGGTWSMHFVGMMAFSLPGIEVSHDVELTLLSLALPIAVTTFEADEALRPGGARRSPRRRHGKRGARGTVVPFRSKGA